MLHCSIQGEPSRDIQKLSATAGKKRPLRLDKPKTAGGEIRKAKDNEAPYQDSTATHQSFQLRLGGTRSNTDLLSDVKVLRQSHNDVAMVLSATTMSGSRSAVGFPGLSNVDSKQNLQTKLSPSQSTYGSRLPKRRLPLVSLYQNKARLPAAGTFGKNRATSSFTAKRIIKSRN